MLSTRPDLLPQPALEELRELCDAVPPFPTADAIAVLEGELGEGAVTRLFEGLDTSTVPVATEKYFEAWPLRPRAPLPRRPGGLGFPLVAGLC